MATVKTIVKTNELKRNGVVYCTGSVRVCAELAAQTEYLKDRTLSDAVLDNLEKDLKKHRAAMFQGVQYEITPIIEEYDEDEEE
jgi:hypothetical protein